MIIRIITLVLCAFALNAQAFEYTLPTDGWYQLQGNGSTLCQTGDQMPCDVDAGTYTLINHTTGNRDEGFRIESLQDYINPNHSIHKVEHFHRMGEEICLDSKECHAACPAVEGLPPGIAVSGNCNARANGVYVTKGEYSINRGDIPGTHQCQTDVPSHMVVQVDCEYHL